MIWQPATLLANDSDAQAVWQKIASGVPNIPAKGQLNGSTINVTYDAVNDPDCCKWHFLSPARPFQEGEGGEGEEGDRQSHDRGSCFRGHATGARLWFDGYETVARKTP